MLLVPSRAGHVQQREQAKTIRKYHRRLKGAEIPYVAAGFASSLTRQRLAHNPGEQYAYSKGHRGFVADLRRTVSPMHPKYYMYGILRGGFSGSIRRFQSMDGFSSPRNICGTRQL